MFFFLREVPTHFEFQSAGRAGRRMVSIFILLLLLFHDHLALSLSLLFHFPFIFKGPKFAQYDTSVSERENRKGEGGEWWQKGVDVM